MSTQSPFDYGTITNSTATNSHAPPSPPSTFISRASSKNQTLISACRPWQELFDIHSFSKPYTYPDAMSRVRRNLFYFRFCYSLVMLIILFLSLVYHPISMIAFLAVFVAWFFLYFFRDEPILLYNRIIDDRVVFLTLSLITIIALVSTHVGLNVLVSLVIGVVVVGLHAAFRVTEELFLDEEDAVEEGLLSVVDSDQQMRPTFYRD